MPLDEVSIALGIDHSEGVAAVAAHVNPSLGRAVVREQHEASVVAAR